MRKSLLLTSLAMLAAASFGCALTDYGVENYTDGTVFAGVNNKSHGVIGCTTDDRMANTQQVLEAETRTLLYAESFGPTVTCGGFFVGFLPLPYADGRTVNHEDARDWNRFIGNWVFFGEAQVFSPASLVGTWYLSGVKDLADGSVRINNYSSPGTGKFSCVGSGSFLDGQNVGRYGGPEGVVVGDKLSRIPDLSIDNVAIDSAPGAQFCENVAAISPAAFARYSVPPPDGPGGYSTFWGLLGRSGEGRIPFTPVTRREGLASFLAGAPMNVTVQGVTATISGNLQADGTVEVSLLGASANGTTYSAVEPIRITVDPATNFRTHQVRAGNNGELGRLADFALQAGLTDRTFDLTGVQVPELGASLPPVQFMINGDFCRWLAGGQQGGSDSNPTVGG